MDRKVVVFVDGNATISSDILVNDGVGFFMLLAGGNITVSTSVGGSQEDPPPLVPDLEGVYFTDGSFNTGTSGAGADEQLHVRGVVVAGNTVNMQRSVAYEDIPSDLFEYGPDQSMMIPIALSRRSISWKEVLP